MQIQQTTINLEEEKVKLEEEIVLVESDKATKRTTYLKALRDYKNSNYKLIALNERLKFVDELIKEKGKG